MSAKRRSVITCFSQIQPATRLVDRARKARAFLMERYADDLTKDDGARIDSGRDYKFLLAGFTHAGDFSLQELL